MTRNQEIARTILNQMGGNKLVAMVGAKNLLAIENGISFRFMRANGMNAVRITLDEGKDLYEMEFLSVHGGTIKQKAHHTDVFCDQLNAIFEKETGLTTHL